MLYDVVIIGAGASGLAAARDLARGSFNVVVIEGRDRIGGRVLSYRLGATDAQLGAEFIHGSAQQTQRLLREIGSQPIAAGEASWTCGEDGALRPEGDEFFEGAMRALEHARTLRADESAESFLQRLERDRQTIRLAAAARAFVEGFEAADPAMASIRSIAEELHTGVDSTIARPAGGYGLIFQHLRGACEAAGVHIRLSARARRITWERGDIKVQLRTESGTSETIKARAAIVTLPVGVLRDRYGDGALAFDPELPATKREALNRIEMGQAVKVALWFRTPFWERLAKGRYRDWAFLHCPRGAFSAYWTQAPEHSNLVIAWAGGPKATALSQRSQAEATEQALNGLGELFGEPEAIRADCEGAAMHDWTSDPFSRGAYSYVRVGGAGARSALATPIEETLFFAGEATSTDGQGGTVNGALETGERAAAQVTASLRESGLA